jgi:hypothetical protein
MTNLTTLTLPPGAIVYVKGLPFKTVKTTQVQGARDNVRAVLTASKQVLAPLPEGPISVLENDDSQVESPRAISASEKRANSPVKFLHKERT